MKLSAKRLREAIEARPEYAELYANAERALEAVHAAQRALAEARRPLNRMWDEEAARLLAATG